MAAPVNSPEEFNPKRQKTANGWKSFVCICLSVLFISSPVFAIDYFISAAGNNSSNGLSPATSWKTIDKVNAEFLKMSPGDRILFNRGDSFTGSLNITKSGSTENPITIGAFGSGPEPVINGFTTVTDWISEGNGIYSKIVSCESSPVIVTVNGINTGMGRFPDTGWMTIDADSFTSLTDSDLNSSVTNWTGAEVAVRVNYFVINHLRVTSHLNHTLTYLTGTTYLPSAGTGDGYFIQNDLRTLTVLKEWYYNPIASKFYMFFGTADPADYIVKVASVNNAVNIHNQGFITFENLSFQGYNKNAFNLNIAPHITIQNSSITFCGLNAVDGTQSHSRTGASKYLIFDNNNISDMGNNGLHLYGGFTNAKITNSSFNNIGLIRGAGYEKDIYAHSGIVIGEYASGNINTVIEYNRFTNIGYNAINFTGTNYTIRFNYINNFCLILDDGAGIYTYDVDNLPRSCTIANNIILNGIGELTGTTDDGSHASPGIYTDGHSNGITITNNTVAGCLFSGYFSNSNTEGTVTGNTLYNNRYGIYINGGMTNMSIKGNILFSRTSTQTVAFFNLSSPPPSSAILDFNCYTRPTADNSTIRYPKSEFITLGQWQKASGKDAGSFKSPVPVTDASKIRFEYNETKTDKIIMLDGDYIDVKGNKYSKNLTLQPFTSIILIVNPGASLSPDIPAYISSVVENDEPSILELLFTLSLIGIVPAASTFSVKVNSVTRNVNDVTISGTKVFLTLSSPVANGDNVTFTYTKPSTNPLQTASGKEVASIDSQVANNMVGYINSPPGIEVLSEPTNFSGFICEIDASGSFDPDNDSLSYQWTAPAYIPVSSTTDSRIQFLSPVTDTLQKIEFTLFVSDGVNSPRVRVIPIEVVPYKPHSEVAEVTDVEASGFMESNYPQNILDGNKETMWADNSDNQWLILILKESFNLQYIRLAFNLSQSRESHFDILGSNDKIKWVPILTTSSSCAFSGDNQVFDFPSAIYGESFRFIKLELLSDPDNPLNYISEVKVFGYRHQHNLDYEHLSVKIYPNPAHDFVNIRIDSPSMNPEYLKIISLSGDVLFKYNLEPDKREFSININLLNGIYIFQLGSGGLTMFTQSLIVLK